MWNQPPLDDLVDLSLLTPVEEMAAIEPAGMVGPIVVYHAPRYFKYLFLLMMVCNIALFTVAYQAPLRNSHPLIDRLYTKLGLHEARGLGLRDVHAKIEQGTEGRYNLSFSAELANLSKEEGATAPDIFVIALNKEGKVLSELSYPLKSRVLEPQSAVGIQTSVNNISPQATRLVLDLRNWLDRTLE